MPENREVIIEFYQLGHMVKVSAIDALTGTEVSIMGKATTSEAYLKKLAVQKLEYMLEKQSSSDN